MKKRLLLKTQKVHILELQIYYDMELILEKDINHYLTKRRSLLCLLVILEGVIKVVTISLEGF